MPKQRPAGHIWTWRGSILHLETPALSAGSILLNFIFLCDSCVENVYALHDQTEKVT